MPETQAIDALEETIRGDVIGPDDPRCDEARSLSYTTV